MNAHKTTRGDSPPLFATGRIVATPGAIRTLERAAIHPFELLARHVLGDWGQLCLDDIAANRCAVELNHRVLSSYIIGQGASAAKVWIITEADRSSTCLLLSDEY